MGGTRHATRYAGTTDVIAGLIGANNADPFTASSTYHSDDSLAVYALSEVLAVALAQQSATFQLREDANGTVNPVVLGTLHALDPEGDPVTYRITAGNESGKFAINSHTGQLTYTGSGESSGTFRVRVRASSFGGISTMWVRVNVVTPPHISFDNPAYSLTLAENMDGSGGTPVLIGTLNATDSAGHELTYSIVGGNSAREFAIGSRDGRLTYSGGAKDYEALNDPGHAYLLTVRAGHRGVSATATVNVAVTDVNEAPAFGSATYSHWMAMEPDGSVDPDSATVTVSASDPDGDTLTYSITAGNDAGKFTIGADTGTITFTGSRDDLPDGSWRDAYSLTVSASDGSLSDTATVTVSALQISVAPGDQSGVLDGSNNNGPNSAPAFGSDSYAFSLAENADGSGTAVTVGTVTATDPDTDDTVTYSLSGTGSGKFAVSAAGVITYTGAGENFESVANPSSAFTLTATASDGRGCSDTATVTVAVTDVNEAPAFGLASYGFNLSENADNIRVGVVSAADPDGNALTYSITAGDDGNKFAINGSGTITYAGGGEDYESAANPDSAFTLTVSAADGAGASSEVAVTIGVTDVDEAPVFGAEGYQFSLAENADGSGTPVVVGSVSATDPEGSDLTYILRLSFYSDKFAIDSDTGEMTYTGAGEDYESIRNPSSAFVLTVAVTDGVNTGSSKVTVGVADVVEATPQTLTALSIGADVIKGTVRILWEPVDDAADYRVMRKDAADEDSEDNWQEMGTVSAEASAKNVRYRDSEVSLGVNYTYRVELVGSTSSYPTVEVGVPADVALVAPQAHVNRGGTVVVRWTPFKQPIFGEVVRAYQVERRTGSEAWQSVGAEQLATTDAQSANRLRLLDDSVAAGTDYEYRILVLAEGGHSVPSEVVAVSVPAAE